MAEEQDLVFREIDAELKQEKLQKLWKEYGAYGVGAVLALVVSFAGFKGWENYDLSQRGEASERFAAAEKLAGDGNAAAAREAYGGIDGGGGYAMLAQFHLAALAHKNGDYGEAAQIYQKLADHTGIDPLYGDLAIILGALAGLDAQPDPDPDGNDLTARLRALADGDGALRFNAREVLALSALYDGDTAKFTTYYSQLADAAAAPQSLRARAREMRLILANR
jgi:hypothetical protein